MTEGCEDYTTQITSLIQVEPSFSIAATPSFAVPIPVLEHPHVDSIPFQVHLGPHSEPISAFHPASIIQEGLQHVPISINQPAPVDATQPVILNVSTTSTQEQKPHSYHNDGNYPAHLLLSGNKVIETAVFSQTEQSCPVSVDNHSLGFPLNDHTVPVFTFDQRLQVPSSSLTPIVLQTSVPSLNYSNPSLPPLEENQITIASLKTLNNTAVAIGLQNSTEQMSIDSGELQNSSNQSRCWDGNQLFIQESGTSNSDFPSCVSVPDVEKIFEELTNISPGCNPITVSTQTSISDFCCSPSNVPCMLSPNMDENSDLVENCDDSDLVQLISSLASDQASKTGEDDCMPKILQGSVESLAPQNDWSTSSNSSKNVEDCWTKSIQDSVMPVLIQDERTKTAVLQNENNEMPIAKDCMESNAVSVESDTSNSIFPFKPKSANDNCISVLSRSLSTSAKTSVMAQSPFNEEMDLAKHSNESTVSNKTTELCNSVVGEDIPASSNKSTSLDLRGDTGNSVPKECSVQSNQ